MSDHHHHDSSQRTTLIKPPYPLFDIDLPHPHDVLCGKGGLSNGHIGNRNYREVVRLNKGMYGCVAKQQKMLVAQSIVLAIRSQNPPGRFLKRDMNGKWNDIGDKKAQEKTSQALREKASVLPDGVRDGDKVKEGFTAQISSHLHTAAVASPVLPSTSPVASFLPCQPSPGISHVPPARENYKRPRLESDGQVVDIICAEGPQPLPCHSDGISIAHPNNHFALDARTPGIKTDYPGRQSNGQPMSQWTTATETPHGNFSEYLKNAPIWGQESESTLPAESFGTNSSFGIPHVSKSARWELKERLMHSRNNCEGNESTYIYVPDMQKPFEGESDSIDKDSEVQPTRPCAGLNNVRSLSMHDIAALVRNTSAAMSDISLSRGASPKVTTNRKAFANNSGRSAGNDAVLAEWLRMPEPFSNAPSLTDNGCDGTEGIERQQTFASRAEHKEHRTSPRGNGADNLDDEEQLEVTFLNRGPSLAWQNFGRVTEKDQFSSK